MNALTGKVDNTIARYWLLVCVLLINLPNLLWIAPNQGLLLNGIEYLNRLVLSLLLITCFVALFARLERAWLAIWLSLLSWQPLAIAVRVVTGAPINSSLIGTAFATSPGEIQGLLASLPLFWLLYFVGWNLLCLYLWRWLQRKQLPRWNWNFRGKLWFFCLSMLAIPYLVLPAKSGPKSHSVPNTSTSPLEQLRQAEKQPGATSYLAEAFPYELPIALAQYVQSRRVIRELKAGLQLPPRQFRLPDQPLAAELVVLVIGESSTRNAWQLFNPDAPPTTPHLLKRQQRGEPLFAFEHTFAQATATLLAVPSILTQQPLLWPSGQTNPNANLSVISIAAETGFATSWLSNQTAAGRHDGVIAAYAEEAASKVFLNPAHYSNQGSYDEVLLPLLRKQFRSHDRVFAVLHTMGSHFHYAHRYPAGFGPFPKASDEREAYYNSVAYTDWLLEQIMQELEQDKRPAVLLYVSDHGESIPQDTCNAGTANRYSRDAYEIPALVWLNRSYNEQFPQVGEQLTANITQAYSANAVPQTLLDLIQGHGNSQLPVDTTQSLLRVPETPHSWPRKVQQAIAKTPCAVFIKQEEP